MLYEPWESQVLFVEKDCKIVFLKNFGQRLIGSLVGMTAFEKVAKACIDKFRQNILLSNIKIIYLLNC